MVSQPTLSEAQERVSISTALLLLGSHVQNHPTCKGRHGLLPAIPPEPGHHLSRGSQHPVHPPWWPQAVFSGTHQ